MEYPAVTICAQGTVYEVVGEAIIGTESFKSHLYPAMFTDAAVYHQLSRWLAEKNININDVITDQNEIQRLGQEFLEDLYPGMEKPPNELIKILTSDDVDKTMNSVAILNPPEDPCESER